MPTPGSPSPEEEARLRRLLAEARETGPLPDEVAERLDTTLAELGDERAAGGDVVPLDRRRRRTLAGVLAAAAVVVVAGVGVQQVLTNSGSGDTMQTSEATSGLDQDAGSAEEENGFSTLKDGEAADDAAPEAASERALTTLEDVELRKLTTGISRIRNRAFEQDALAVRRSLPPGALDRYRPTVLYAAPDFSCSPAYWGTGVLVGVDYGGRPAVLAFREPSKQNQVAEVLQCGTGDGLRSVTLSAP